jgi:hypothetical protein
MIRNYGYIIDKNLFNGQANDVQWNFERYDSEGDVTQYNGIETDRDLSSDSNIINIGDYKSFRIWIREFQPPII